MSEQRRSDPIIAALIELMELGREINGYHLKSPEWFYEREEGIGFRWMGFRARLFELADEVKRAVLREWDHETLERITPAIDAHHEALEHLMKDGSDPDVVKRYGDDWFCAWGELQEWQRLLAGGRERERKRKRGRPPVEPGRDEAIYESSMNGMSTADIAKEHGLTERHVRRIINEQNAKAGH